MMKYKIIGLVWFILVFLKVAAQDPAQRIPEFNFFKLDNTAFTHKNVQPGKLSLFVLIDTDCDHCQHAIEFLNQHSKEISKVSLYLVSMDSPERIEAFMKKFGSGLKNQKNVTILKDFNNEFITKFRVMRFPSLLLYAKDKKLLLYENDEKNIPGIIEKIKRAS